MAEARTFALARRHGLTVYDAVYLELAHRRGAILATFDDQLRRAASKEGFPSQIEPAGENPELGLAVIQRLVIT